MTAPDGFVAMILTWGRPGRVKTYEALKRHGYTGPILLIVDDLDPSLDDYIQEFGDEVVVFDKRASAARTDSRTNSGDLRSVVFARNETFRIAREHGYDSFVMLDDDYSDFSHRMMPGGIYVSRSQCTDLDEAFAAMDNFMAETPTASIAFAQGGDFIGGEHYSPVMKKVVRKAMNSFFCRTDREFMFEGILNDDVNTFASLGSRGLLFFTLGEFQVQQTATQSSDGGLTDIYLTSGTYVKSFATILDSPSGAVIGPMGAYHPRWHHRISWRHQVPCILREEHRKQ